MRKPERRNPVTSYALLGVMLLGVAACDETTGPNIADDVVTEDGVLASVWMPGEGGMEFEGALEAPGDLTSGEVIVAEAWEQATLSVPEIESIRDEITAGGFYSGSPFLQEAAQKKAGKSGKTKKNRKRARFGDDGGTRADRTQVFAVDGHEIRTVYSHDSKKYSNPPRVAVTYIDGILVSMSVTKWVKRKGEWTAKKVTTTMFDEQGNVTAVTVLDRKALKAQAAAMAPSRLEALAAGIDRLACRVGQALAPSPLHATTTTFQSCDLPALEKTANRAQWTFYRAWAGYGLAATSCILNALLCRPAFVLAAANYALAARNLGDANDAYNSCLGVAARPGSWGAGGGLLDSGTEFKEPVCVHLDLFEDDGTTLTYQGTITLCY